MKKPLDDKELRKKIALTSPRLWCDECPYKKTMHLCIEGKACRWQLDYADQILALLQPKIEEAKKQERERAIKIVKAVWSSWQ